MDWTSKKLEEHRQSICGQRQDKGFLKSPSVERAGELLSLSRNQLRIMTGFLTGQCHLRGYLFKLGWYTVPSVVDASRHMKRSHTFFVAVRLWPL